MPKRRARSVGDKDFDHFDLILAIDDGNLADLRRLCPSHHQHKLRLFMSLAEQLPGDWPTNVPDLDHGNAQGFGTVLDLCEAGVKGLLNFDFKINDRSV